MLRFFVIAMILMSLWNFKLFGQCSGLDLEWRPIQSTAVSVNSSTQGDAFDAYVDKDGIHSILHRDDKIEYYLFDPNDVTGTPIRSSMRDNIIILEEPKLCRIVGISGRVYITYKKDGVVKTQESVDAGQTWTNLDNLTLSLSNSNGIDAFAESSGLHLVFSNYDPNNVVETFYRFSLVGSNDWINLQTVTDDYNDDGSFPSIAVSPNRVHVSYTDSRDAIPGFQTGLSRSRDRFNLNWQNSIDVSPSQLTILNSIIASATKLHMVYYVRNLLVQDQYYTERDFGSTQWTTPVFLRTGGEAEFAPTDMAVTTDNKVHFTLGEERYTIWDGTICTNSYRYANEFFTSWPRIAADNNDIYVVWLSDVDEKIHFRQRNLAAPSAPTGLTRSIESFTQNPRIDWTASIAADIKHYQISKKKGSDPWNDNFDTTTLNFYVDQTETGTSLYTQANNIEIKYRISAVDGGLKESIFF